MNAHSISKDADNTDPDIAGRDEKIFKTFLSQTGAPAFMRRALRVSEAEDGLMARCLAQRDELLAMVRLRLGMLRALAGQWENLASVLAPGDIVTLRKLEETLTPAANHSLPPTTAKSSLLLAYRELAESVARFNRRWLDHLREVDLTDLNELRANYNRYYVLEKECITRSPRLARQGFTPLAPLTHDELLRRFPLLPELGNS